MDSKKRFSNRVDTYVKYRPSYPKEAIDCLYDTVGLHPDCEVADVGAGTGIFTKLLLERGSRVTAVEPNKEMREAAIEALGSNANFRTIPGSAEDTGLPDESVDFITCAQSFHWFHQQRAKAEFHRILKPGGKAVLIWNSRLTEGTAFLEEYEHLLQRYGTDYNEVKHTNISPESLIPFFAAGTMRIARFPNRQLLDFDGLAGRLHSSSYSPTPEHPNYEPMMRELKAIFDRNQQGGRISFDYVTEIFWGAI